MEDHHAVDVDTDLGIPGLNGVSLITVLDGHAGKEASNFARNHLHRNIIAAVQRQSKQKEPVDLRAAIEEAFAKTDAEFLEMAHRSGVSAGSTCVSAVVTRDSVLVANIGDSRCILCLEPPSLGTSTCQTSPLQSAGTTHGNLGANALSANTNAGLASGGASMSDLQVHVPFVEMSIDHKPNRPDEQQRIESSGGFIAHIGCWRVLGMLATSRSFGDKDLKRFVISVPEFVEVPLPNPQNEGEIYSHNFSHSYTHNYNHPALSPGVGSATVAGTNTSTGMSGNVSGNSVMGANASVNGNSTSNLNLSGSLNTGVNIGNVISQPSATSASPTASNSSSPTPTPALLVLATDGLWDVFTNQEVADFVYRRRDEELYGADELILQALRRGSTDNITVAVADLRRERTQVIPPASNRKKL
eukprot:TRINITY_DN3658_c0_g2_i4.p1 TRINITY_DN3658_c0_g2~~TRINITY_DN3658_c0_g2_i4.p1  ORF type:complete len:416 (-),score=98.89 TRINITY_DN3658_c0_g2_i4:2146-3393(-)